MKNSLERLSKLVSSNTIVVCKADKDGKILEVDYDDYSSKVMYTELS